MRPLLLLLLAVSVPAGAQVAPTRLVVVVADGVSREPLAGVRVEAAGVAGATDAQGRAGWQGLPPGEIAVAVRPVGYAPLDTVLTVASGQTLVAVLTLAPATLGEALVESESLNDAMLRRRGFFERREGRAGIFLTRAEIERRGAIQFSDVFRSMLGFRVERERGQAAIVSSRNPTCRPEVFVDGTRAAGMADQIDALLLAGVAAVEIYRGPSETPMSFSRRGPGAPCGAVLVWTQIDAGD